MELFTKKLGFAVVQLILVCCDYDIRPINAGASFLRVTYYIVF